MHAFFAALHYLASAVCTAPRRATPPRRPLAVARAALLRDDATADEVGVVLGPKARTTIAAAREYRKLLKAIPILTRLHEGFTIGEAKKCGVVVPPDHTVDAAVMTVGVFEVPVLNTDIVRTPKSKFSEAQQRAKASAPALAFRLRQKHCGARRLMCLPSNDALVWLPCSALRAAYEGMAKHAQDMLLVPQRVQYACELVTAVEARDVGFGTHLTGPNGAGKSGALLLAYLMCAARDLPTAFIPQPSLWVDAAGSDDGGAAFMLETIWRQNADLIVGDPELRRVFQAALQDSVEPSPAAAMRALHDAACGDRCPPVAVILDEVQHITLAVQAAKVPDPTHATQLRGAYFEHNWYSWTSNECFPLLTAASAHVNRDTNLPSGQEHRLRVVEPLADADRAALQALPRSPIYVEDAGVRDFVVSAAGNILRNLAYAAAELPRGRKASKEDRVRLWDALFARMENPCVTWLASLPESNRGAVGDTVMDVLRSKTRWGGTTDHLYDKGIVYRTANSVVVRPVSAAASAVLFRVVANYVKGSFKPLWKLTDGSVRGPELKRQVLATLEVLDRNVPSKLLSGQPATAPQLLHLRSVYSLPFTDIPDVSLRDHHVFYRPLDRNFACDGILMPPADDPNGHIYLVECSVTEPHDTDRVRKVGGWYNANGLVQKVEKAFPGRAVTAVLCYDKTLQLRKTVSARVAAMSHGKHPPPEGTHPCVDATAIGDKVRVLDGGILHSELGVTTLADAPPGSTT